MVQMNGDKLNELAKGVLLRLDDGSLIGTRSSLKEASDGSALAARVDAVKAYEIGKLGPEQVVRMEQMVFRMGALVHGDSWVEEPLTNKRKGEFGQDFGNGDFKRARSAAPALNGGNGGLAGSPSLASQGSWGVGEFEGKCLEMVSALLAELGPDAYIFANPVDPAKVKDYYTVIKQPMDLGTIQGKLNRREYRNPSEFYDDVMLVWANCNTYNKKGDYVQKLGMRCEASFQRMWSASGLCLTHRARRTNAGVAAEKYEPAEMLPPEKKRLATGIKAPRAVAAGPAAKPSRSRQPNLDRMRSADDSFKPRRKMTQEQLQTLATALQQLDGQTLQGAIEFIKNAAGSTELGDGEIELDFDALDSDTLWSLHDYVQANSGNATALNNAFPAAQEASESESESESE